jgi:hypothetical protein
MRLQMLQDQQSNGQQYQSSANMASKGRGGFNSRGRGSNRGRGGRGGVALVVAATAPLEQMEAGYPLPRQSARSVTSLITLLLSVGIGLRRTSSPITRMQVIQRPMVLTLIGTSTVEHQIISRGNSTSSQ